MHYTSSCSVVPQLVYRRYIAYPRVLVSNFTSCKIATATGSLPRYPLTPLFAELVCGIICPGKLIIRPTIINFLLSYTRNSFILNGCIVFCLTQFLILAHHLAEALYNFS